MFTRHAQVQNFDAQGNGSDFQNQGESGSEQQQQQSPDRIYNEYRKLQRLFEKQGKELEALKGEFAPVKSQLSRFQSMFSGPQVEDDKPLSYLEKVRRADRSIREADPGSNGLALTLEGAEMLEKIREENNMLKQQMQRMSSPQSIAENQMFVMVEGYIKDEIERFFGAEGVDDNYPDFERVAITKLKEVRKDPKKWAQIVRSPEAQKNFCRAVISAKMPKIDKLPGWQKIDTYSIQDAQRDLERSEKLAIKARQERSRDGLQQASDLARKARQRLLPETLGLKFRDDV